jgi:hypothetical protein
MLRISGPSWVGKDFKKHILNLFKEMFEKDINETTTTFNNENFKVEISKNHFFKGDTKVYTMNISTGEILCFSIRLRGNKDLNNHISNIIDNMIETGQNKVDTIFKDVQYTIERMSGKLDEFIVINNYYGVGS